MRILFKKSYHIYSSFFEFFGCLITMWALSVSVGKAGDTLLFIRVGTICSRVTHTFVPVCTYREQMDITHRIVYFRNSGAWYVYYGKLCTTRVGGRIKRNCAMLIKIFDKFISQVRGRVNNAVSFLFQFDLWNYLENGYGGWCVVGGGGRVVMLLRNGPWKPLSLARESGIHCA